MKKNHSPFCTICGLELNTGEPCPMCETEGVEPRDISQIDLDDMTDLEVEATINYAKDEGTSAIYDLFQEITRLKKEGGK